MLALGLNLLEIFPISVRTLVIFGLRQGAGCVRGKSRGPDSWLISNEARPQKLAIPVFSRAVNRDQGSHAAELPDAKVLRRASAKMPYKGLTIYYMAGLFKRYKSGNFIGIGETPCSVHQRVNGRKVRALCLVLGECGALCYRTPIFLLQCVDALP